MILEVKQVWKEIEVALQVTFKNTSFKKKFPLKPALTETENHIFSSKKAGTEIEIIFILKTKPN